MSGSTTILGPNGVTLQVVPEDTKVDIRRFCGYPAFGYGVSGFYNQGLFLPEYETMELRLNSLTQSEYARVINLFLPNLLALEGDLFDIRDDIDIDTAAIYKRNSLERVEREKIFQWWTTQLLNFLGLDPGPMFTGGRGTMMCDLHY